MLCLVFTTAILGGFYSQQTRAGDLAINPVVQQAPGWCWAAAAQMVLAHYGFPNLNPNGNYQCGVVSAQGGSCSANCGFCLNPAGSNQRVAAVIQAYAQSAAQARGFASPNFQPRLYGILPPQEIIRAVDNNAPILAGISPTLLIPPGLGLSQHAVVIVGYSGGYVPTAWSLQVGGLGYRVRGVFLLDAVYGELDKFAAWIENNRSAFFVSSYTHYTKRRDLELMRMLRARGITVAEDMDQPLKPGSVVFVETPDGITHRDYVTLAWTELPVREVLVKMADSPALTRVAASSPGSR
jgi:hypothetical protein